MSATLKQTTQTAFFRGLQLYNMKKTTLAVIILIAEIMVSKTMLAQGTLYLSNLSQVTVGNADIGSDSWIAQRIYTGNDSMGYNLNSIQLLMDAASGNPSGFTVSIYSSSSGNPNHNLGRLMGSDPSGGGFFTYTASNISLLPSTAYFIVLTSSTTIAQGNYDWSAAYGLIRGSNQWSIDDSYFSSVNGLNWTETIRQDVFQLGIYATAVPEPSIETLLGLGGLLLWGIGRRKAKVQT